MERFTVPRRFHVTSGEATDGASELNAFDLALADAGIAHCNLVEVSSILPPDCEEVEELDVPVGAITHCVLARAVGGPGHRIGCGLSWAWGAGADGDRFGIVAEHHGQCDEAEAERMLRLKLARMAEARGMELEAIRLLTRSVLVPDGSYGCVVTVLVFSG